MAFLPGEAAFLRGEAAFLLGETAAWVGGGEVECTLRECPSDEALIFRVGEVAWCSGCVGKAGLWAGEIGFCWAAAARDCFVPGDMALPLLDGEVTTRPSGDLALPGMAERPSLDMPLEEDLLRTTRFLTTFFFCTALCCCRKCSVVCVGATYPPAE